jgi:urease accessory protein
VRAVTELEVGLDAAGTSVLRRVHCEAPLLVRAESGEHGLTLWLVGGAAGPLGGDELSLSLRVDTGARVSVRSVAAQAVHPCPHGTSSTLRTTIDVDDDAVLDWAPEPTLSVVGSVHTTSMEVRASPSARVRVAEVLVLGRHGEEGGTITLTQRAWRGDDAVLHTSSTFGPGVWTSPGANGPFRTFRTELVLGADAPTSTLTSVDRDRVHATLAIAPAVALVTTAHR